MEITISLYALLFLNRELSTLKFKFNVFFNIFPFSNFYLQRENFQTIILSFKTFTLAFKSSKLCLNKNKLSLLQHDYL